MGPRSNSPISARSAFSQASTIITYETYPNTILSPRAPSDWRLTLPLTRRMLVPPKPKPSLNS
jgi:hypothetical protein